MTDAVRMGPAQRDRVRTLFTAMCALSRADGGGRGAIIATAEAAATALGVHIATLARDERHFEALLLDFAGHVEAAARRQRKAIRAGNPEGGV